MARHLIHGDAVSLRDVSSLINAFCEKHSASHPTITYIVAYMQLHETSLLWT